jgi:carboxymethylenebutenolidase
MLPLNGSPDVERRVVVVPTRQQNVSGRFEAYFSRPAESRGVSVLLLPEMFGVTEAMRGSADAFAAAGFPALVPNLFWRYGPPGVLAYEGVERQTAWNRLQAFDRPTSLDDMRDAVHLLQSELAPGEPVFAVGHCLGGRLAVFAAARLKLAGASSFYGLGLSQDAACFSLLGAPVQLHYGLADEHVPADEIAAVEAITRDNPQVEIFSYPGAGHSFCNPARPSYDPEAAARAMERTIAAVAWAASPKDAA